MAEAVEKNIETSLSELHLMRKLKLFTKQEINEIIRKRRQHEYCLQKRNKRLLDYEAYISTELSVLKLLEFRRQKMEDRRFKDKIEQSIVSRLCRLHRQSCFRFQSRIDVWIRFIQFCKAIGRHLSVVRLWNRVLKIHGRTDPRLWAAAASYHLHENTETKIRSTLRSLSVESNRLTREHKKLKQKLAALKRYVHSKEQDRIQSVVDELRTHSEMVEQAANMAAQDRRLAWDRIYLTNIREARHLLTEGITLNPDNRLLYLELAKLEAAAVDFFINRVQPRMVVIPSINQAVSENEASKRSTPLSKIVKEENETFLKSVTEDINFITSGRALKLVIENIMERWSSDKDLLESIKSTTSGLHTDQINKKLKTKLALKIKEANQSSVANKISNQPSPANVLMERLSQLHTCLLPCQLSSGGEEAAPVACQHLLAGLALWDSWYPTDESFRCLDPQQPGASGLLRARVLLHKLMLSWKSVLTDSLAEPSTSSWCYLNRGEITKTMRRWLDNLATSRWGVESSEFWTVYLDFEGTSGDCTRIPSIHWRAKRLLKPESLKTFINSTVSSSTPC